MDFWTGTVRAGGRPIPLGVIGANPRITPASASNSSRAFTGYVFAGVPPRVE